MEHVYWNEVGKGHNGIKLHPDMMSDGGLTVTIFACLSGESKSRNRMMQVTYNKHFVIHRLKLLVRDIALGTALGDWTHLFDILWHEINDETEQ